MGARNLKAYDRRDLFVTQWRILAPHSRHVMTTEHRFHPKRRWRFDVAFPALKVAVEIEGGVYTGGRHTRGSGFIKDCEKYNEASALGWTVVRIPAVELTRDPVGQVAVVERVLRAQGRHVGMRKLQRMQALVT